MITFHAFYVTPNVSVGSKASVPCYLRTALEAAYKYFLYLEQPLITSYKDTYKTSNEYKNDTEIRL